MISNFSRNEPMQIFRFFILVSYIILIVIQPSIQFLPNYIVWFQDRQRLLELLLLSLILIYYAFNHQNSRSVIQINKYLRYTLVFLLLLSMTSAFLAISTRHALIEICVYAALSFLALFFADFYRDESEFFIKRLSYIILASIFLYMTSFYVGYITAMTFKTPLNWPFPFTGFSNIRSFNQYQLWLLGLVSFPLLSFEFKSKIKLTCLYLSLTLWWVLLFYSASRGVLIAWFVGLLFTVIAYRTHAYSFLKLQLIQISTGFFIYYLLFKIIPSINQSTLVTGTVFRETTNDRLALWNLAIDLIQKFPILGVGPMGYAWYSKSNAHPHNSLLQLASEWGLIATTIILIILGYGLYYWFKKFNMSSLKSLSKPDKSLTIILFFTIITNATYSLVDGVLVTPISQVLMFTIIGLMIGHYADPKETSIHYKSKTRPVLSGIILLVMLWSTYPEISNGLTGDEKGFSIGHTALGPRFWKEVR